MEVGEGVRGRLTRMSADESGWRPRPSAALGAAGRVVEGARLESDHLCTEIVTKHHTFPDRTHDLSHFPALDITICHTLSTHLCMHC